MKKSLAVFALVLMFAVPAMAADSVVYNAKNGTVITFDHKGHAARTACKECHGEGAPAKVIVAGKEKAHALCLTCHKKLKDAKVSGKCSECHKK
jgi:c(7)-type cytochrome triheme protein